MTLPVFPGGALISSRTEATRPAVRLMSVIVPVFNESRTIEAAVDALLKAELPLPIDVVIVDDGSTDGTGDVLDKLAEHKQIRVFRHERNRGKGAAIRTGLGHAAGEVTTIFDADREYDPGDYASLLKPMIDGDARIVYGTRSFSSHSSFSFWYVLGNKFVNLWASFLFNTWLEDVETCFKMADTTLWRSLNLRSNGFGIEAEATGKFLRSGAKIYEVPISYKARTREEGKKLRWTDGVGALTILLRVRLGLHR